jgi:predicted DNA-binding transcriptional regulator AlpA
MEIVNVTQASEILGVTRKTVYNMQKRGELPDPITVTALMEYLQQQYTGLQRIEGRLGEHLQDNSQRKIAIG